MMEIIAYCGDNMSVDITTVYRGDDYQIKGMPGKVIYYPALYLVSIVTSFACDGDNGLRFRLLLTFVDQLRLCARAQSNTQRQYPYQHSGTYI